MIKKIVIRIFIFIINLIKYMPFRTVMRLRNLCYKVVLKKMGRFSNIADAVTITNPRKVSLGQRVSIHEYTYIGTVGEVVIGNNVSIGADCSVISDSHNFSKKDVPIKKQGVTAQPVIIGDDVWLGTKVTVLGPVKIGNGAVIGAGSVVTKDVPDYAVCVGVPCRVLRYR